MRGRQINGEQGYKLLEKDKFENPSNVPKVFQNDLFSGPGLVAYITIRSDPH